MTCLTAETFDVQLATHHALVLFALADSVNGNLIAATMKLLDPTKVGVFRVDIDNAADVAMRFSIRESPTVIYFADGIAIKRDNHLTEEMLRLAVG